MGAGPAIWRRLLICSPCVNYGGCYVSSPARAWRPTIEDLGCESPPLPGACQSTQASGFLRNNARAWQWWGLTPQVLYRGTPSPVSYTHLTLPTSDLV